ncbi:MAG: aminopeptidase P family protein [Bacillota bacterium]|nr:aminopeptidase P family protein [Bacillota bacterium]
MHKSRLDKLRAALYGADCEAMFIVNESNVKYLSGFTSGESFLFIVTAGSNYFITDFRYIEQAEQQCPYYQVLRYRDANTPLPKVLADLCAKYQVKKLAFEREHISYAMFESISGSLQGIQLLPTDSLVEQVRAVKDEGEIENLRIACRATDDVFDMMCGWLHPGVTEREAKWQMYCFINDTGCVSSFKPIIAAGANGSKPHAKPSARQLQNGDLLTMDFGCAYKGYHADITRTVCIGNPDEKQKEIYGVVLEANLRAEAALKAGMTGQAIDAIARDYITEQGYGEQFGHGLGHGVGMDIHELPNLNRANDKPLPAGALVTVEPGIYIPDWGGVRIEDTCLVTEDGCEIMFRSTKELLCL